MNIAWWRRFSAPTANQIQRMVIARELRKV